MLFQVSMSQNGPNPGKCDDKNQWVDLFVAPCLDKVWEAVYFGVVHPNFIGYPNMLLQAGDQSISGVNDSDLILISVDISW